MLISFIGIRRRSLYFLKKNPYGTLLCFRFTLRELWLFIVLVQCDRKSKVISVLLSLPCDYTILIMIPTMLQRMSSFHVSSKQKYMCCLQMQLLLHFLYIYFFICLSLFPLFSFVSVMRTETEHPPICFLLLK